MCNCLNMDTTTARSTHAITTAMPAANHTACKWSFLKWGFEGRINMRGVGVGGCTHALGNESHC
ncbi:hypothetical protein Hanom_Chr09g00824081 [Helianthus anomalus]